MTTDTSTMRIVEMPQRNLAFVRNVGPYAGDQELFARLFNQVSAWAGPKGLMANPNMEAVSVYHDSPESVPPSEYRISVGFTVPQGTQGEGDIQIMELPAGKYAVGSFEIPAEDYGKAWGEMMEYIKSENITPSGLMYESYKNEPETHPEGMHLVDICIAIQ